jgi:hypothetical protein
MYADVGELLRESQLGYILPHDTSAIKPLSQNRARFRESEKKAQKVIAKMS